MTTNDQTIEAQIQAKGKTAARVTPADIEANIASEHYFTAADGARMSPHGNHPVQDMNTGALGLLTFCVLVLKNGFTVTGESACASPENFDRNLRGKPRGSARGSSEQAGTACGATSVASGQLACEVQQGQPHQPLPTAMLSGE